MKSNILSYQSQIYRLSQTPVIFLLFIFLLCSNTEVFTQNNQGIIQGIIKDKLDKIPLEYVTVAVQHARFPKVLNGTITDAKGQFKITNMAPGNYRLSLSFVGYEDQVINDITISEDNILTDVGIIELGQGVGLEEVEVLGKRSLIEQHFDKIVYNTENDISTGQTLNDMLRKVPMVSVDAQGNVSLRGNTNIQILIDGKPAAMFSSNVTDALQAIPPNQVKKIEVITMPSARYDAEGSAGVINIITKQAEHKGYSYSVSLSAGNQSNNGNTNARIKGKKISFNLSAGFNKMSMPDIQTATSRIIESDEVTTQLNQFGATSYQYTTGNVQTGLNYQLNSFNELTSSFRYSPRITTSNQVNDISLLINSIATPTINRQNESTGNNATINWVVDYNRKFRNPNIEWKNSFQLAQADRTSIYNLTEIENKSEHLNEQSDNTSYNLELIAQSDYLQKVNAKFKFELGAKLISRDIQTVSLQQVYNYNLEAYQLAEDRSFTFPYHQQIAAAYFEGNYQLITNWTLRTGLRLEHTNNLINEKVKNTYTNLAPSIALNFLSGKSTLTFSYARRLTRPGLSYLNPFENRSDPLNWRQGNPYLRPELVDAFDMNFSQPVKQTFLNGSLFFHRTRDIIERQTNILSSDKTITTYSNIGNNYRIGLNAFFSTTLSEKLNLKGGSNVIYYNLSNTYLASGSYNQGIQVSLYGMLSCQFSKGWTTELVGAYLTPEWTAQQRNSSFYTYQLSVKKDVFRSGSLSITTVNPLTPHLNISKETTAENVNLLNNISVPLRMINIGFRYSFNKNLVEQPDNTLSNETDLKQAESNKPY